MYVVKFNVKLKQGDTKRELSVYYIVKTPKSVGIQEARADIQAYFKTKPQFRFINAIIAEQPAYVLNHHGYRATTRIDEQEYKNLQSGIVTTMTPHLVNPPVPSAMNPFAPSFNPRSTEQIKKDLPEDLY